ncbi:MAG: HEAT repeat domain-containing protein [Candidatus Neomarinimicrobiota bacterium]
MQNQAKHSKIHYIVLLLLLALAGTSAHTQTSVSEGSNVVTKQGTTYVVGPEGEKMVITIQDDDWEFESDDDWDEEWDDDWDEEYLYNSGSDWTMPEILEAIELPTEEMLEDIRESLDRSREAIRHERRAVRVENRRLRSRRRMAQQYDQEEWDELKKAYKAGYNLILEEKWLEALTALREFISKYPSTNYTDDARFWICYAQEHSGTAATEVFEVYQLFIADFPKSKWADDAKASLITIGRQLVAKNRKQREKYGPIVKRLQQDLDNEVALAALASLTHSDDESAQQAIIGIYDPEGDEKFRKKVVYALGHMEGDDQVAKLADIARRDPSEDVRKVAIRSLLYIDTEAAFDAFSEIAKDSPDADVRLQAVRASGHIDSDRVVAVLLDLAQNDPHIRVRTEAAALLGHLDTPAAREALIQLLERK